MSEILKSKHMKPTSKYLTSMKFYLTLNSSFNLHFLNRHLLSILKIMHLFTLRIFFFFFFFLLCFALRVKAVNESPGWMRMSYYQQYDIFILFIFDGLKVSQTLPILKIGSLKRRFSKFYREVDQPILNEYAHNYAK